MVRTFYAVGDTRTPVKIAFWAIIINVLGTIFFSLLIHEWFPGITPFRVTGLAIASTIAAFVNMLFLLVMVKIRFTAINLTALLKPAGKYMVFALVAGYASYRTLYAVDTFFNTLTVVGLLSQTAIAGLVGTLIYVALSLIFRVPEARKLVGGAISIFRKR